MKLGQSKIPNYYYCILGKNHHSIDLKNSEVRANFRYSQTNRTTYCHQIDGELFIQRYNWKSDCEQKWIVKEKQEKHVHCFRVQSDCCDRSPGILYIFAFQRIVDVNHRCTSNLMSGGYKNETRKKKLFITRISVSSLLKISEKTTRYHLFMRWMLLLWKLVPGTLLATHWLSHLRKWELK